MAIDDDLETYLGLLTESGSSIADRLAPGLAAGEVRSALGAIGLDAPDDAVSLWSWRNGAPDGLWGGPHLFWETSDLRPLAEFIQVWEMWQKTADADDIDVDWRRHADMGEMFPGPRTWFPILMLDETELMFIDCGRTDDRGAIWFGYSSDIPSRLFSSLGAAIGAAAFCLEAGLWRVDHAGRIECDRDTVPAAGDIDHPPWRVL